MSKLLQVIKPRNDENLFSYINRLTLENSYESNIWILNDSNISRFHGPRNLLPWKFDFTQFMNITGISISEILLLTFHKEFGFEEGDEFESQNYLLYKECLMGPESNICPKCLDEFGQNNKLWDIRFLFLCPIHSCILVTKCPNCGKGLKQYRKKFFYCDCKMDLRQIKTTEIVHKSSFIFPNLLYFKFYNEEIYRNKIVGHKLLGVELKNILLIFMFFIKLFYRDKTKTGSTAIPYDPENTEIFGLINKISYIFENWPYNFYDFLIDYEKKGKSRPKFDRGSIINNFGYFHIDLYRKYTYSSFDFIREEFENYIFENWERTHISYGKNFKRDFYSAKYLSTTQVAKMLRVQHSHVRRLISNGYLKAKVTTERTPYLLIYRESAEEYITNRKQFMNREEVCQFLNVGYASVVELEKNNLLKIIRSPYVDGHFEYLYDRKKVEHLMAVIERRYKKYKGKSLDEPDSKLKLTDITRGPKFVVGTNISDILILIIKGYIIPVEKNNLENGLKKYLIPIKELQEEMFENKISTGSGVFSIPELIKFSGLGRTLITRIIQSGILKTTNEMKNPYINGKDAILFKQKYITLSELSILTAINEELLIKQLNKKSVNPILDCSYKRNKLYEKEVLSFLITGQN